MTRLDRQDAYLLEFTATITAVSPAGPDASLVRLDGSAFYPTGGGQEHDTGTLAGVPVTDVVVDAEGVAHRVAAAAEHWRVGAVVRGVIDAERRARHRARHSAQHLLSQAFVRIDPAFATRAVSLAQADMTVDLAGDPDDAAVAAAEALANDVAYGNHPVATMEVSDAELARFPLRRAPKVTGVVRLVAMGPGADHAPERAWELSACGGTHVRATAEVAPIAVLRRERIRGGLMRVTFRAGREAAADHRAKHEAASRAAALLSVGVPDLVDKVAALLRDAAEMRAALAQSRAGWAGALADALAPQAVGSVIGSELPAAEADLLTPLADALAARGLTGAVGVAAGGRASFVLASGDGRDVRPALADALAAVGGRGGGKPERAQGSGPRVDGLAAGLAAATSRLRGG